MTSYADNDQIEYILSQLDDADIRRLNTIELARENAVCILPPTERILTYGLCYEHTDATARPIPRRGWRLTSLGMEVYDRHMRRVREATRW